MTKIIMRFALLFFLVVVAVWFLVFVKGQFIGNSKYESEARSTAEKYWNSQKKADVKMFRSVTPHKNMKNVFAWSFVRNSDIQTEMGNIEVFRQDLLSFMVYQQKFKSKRALQDIHEAATFAKKIEIQHPFLGTFLQYAYWDTITPPNFADLSTYKLMGYEYIVDVEFQSEAGITLKKRVTTVLRRLFADDYDSGWKVLFIPGS